MFLACPAHSRGTQVVASLSFLRASDPGPSFPLALHFASLIAAFPPATHDSLFALLLRVDVTLGLLD